MAKNNSLNTSEYFHVQELVKFVGDKLVSMQQLRRRRTILITMHVGYLVFSWDKRFGLWSSGSSVLKMQVTI